MGLMQLNSEGWNKIETAIAIIRQNEPPEGYYVADSGGKDSGVVVDLCKQSGVKFDAHYNVSPIDPPEVYQFLKQYRPETQWDYYARGFWKGKAGLPTRRFRWCCALIKEAGGIGRTKITGIRWAESSKRKSRCMIETHKKFPNTFFLHPIICWSDKECQEYYDITHIPRVCLYEQGFKRVGCIGCPQDRVHRLAGLERYPKIAHNWRAYADRYFDAHPNTPSLKLLGSKSTYWDWWLSNLSVKKFLVEYQGRLE